MIEGFVTRDEAGLVPPESVSRNIDPSLGGVAIHYGGPAQKIRSHNDCIKRWKQWQSFHMSKDWSDIAYNGGFCQHGYAFAGRGFGTRSAANGTNEANFQFYAFCWIGGEGETPTDKAIRAAAWWVQEARKHGRAGDGLQPHSSFKSTACCGDPLRSRLPNISRLADEPTPEPATTEEEEVLKREDEGPNVRFWKHRLKLAATNRFRETGDEGLNPDNWPSGLSEEENDYFGGSTQALLNRYKKNHGLDEDGLLDGTAMAAIAAHVDARVDNT